MFKFIIVFLFVLTIVFFPIHLKITLKYTNKVLEIYIYKKKLDVNKPLKSNLKDPLKSKPTKIFFKPLNLRDLDLSDVNLNNINLITHKFKNLKFKPTLILNTKLEYGFDDAALVAILFGLIHSAYSLLYLILINFVKVKNIDLKVTPQFKENNLNMEISSIIYINFVKIIYMAFTILPCLINIKHNKTNFKKYRGGNVHG
ncbi:DUF2953 domain-containing protein [Clostridium estertheticum]|uniref:DUF2953 domain-containing protein n=1 Tax=Clostridium estertheticum TaxID=238834 RepID=UPI001CF1F526|nr:DUF2953 domain-containing protein [Clostridium estertheticum]MCB2308019.1 DUF2953 domain-containing protein [Clostridium estertheticum]MCB2346143.1 DUF2953 domain-containing protein [Clostridium estertheticum]MCB2351439.1 DUF2953 domain-containing protein [Clostridium estertheticum]WAG44605.1 DUF2953 domain-containing protein [Clostridium estertheticum]